MNVDLAEELLWFGDNVDDGYLPEDAETYREDCSTEDSDKEDYLEKDSDEEELEIPYTSTGSWGSGRKRRTEADNSGQFPTDYSGRKCTKNQPAGDLDVAVEFNAGADFTRKRCEEPDDDQ